MAQEYSLWLAFTKEPGTTTNVDEEDQFPRWQILEARSGCIAYRQNCYEMHISAVITGSADTRTGYRNEQSYGFHNIYEQLAHTTPNDLSLFYFYSI